MALLVRIAVVIKALVVRPLFRACLEHPFLAPIQMIVGTSSLPAETGSMNKRPADDLLRAPRPLADDNDLSLGPHPIPDVSHGP